MQVSFIGLGVMGYPMAGHLQQAGSPRGARALRLHIHRLHVSVATRVHACTFCTLIADGACAFCTLCVHVYMMAIACVCL